MTDKEYEEMRIKLNEYRDTVRRLNRRSEEAQRWSGMSVQSTGGVFGQRSGSNRGDSLGSIAATALSLQEECDELGALAANQRARLCSCVERIPQQNYREILESVYLNGNTIEAVAEIRAVTPRTIWRWLRSATAKLHEHSDFFR